MSNSFLFKDDRKDTIFNVPSGEAFSQLDTLPSNLRSVRNNIVKTIIDGDIEKLKSLFNNQESLSNWTLGVTLALDVKNTVHTEDVEEQDEVDTSAKFRAEFSVLHLAIICDNRPAVLAFLLDYLPESELDRRVRITGDANDGVATTEQWIFNATCVHLAVKYMPLGLDMILSKKSDLKEDPTQISQTYPLHLAAMNQDSLSTKVLMKFNANVNVRDSIGYYPLHYASRLNRIANLVELLDHGANPFVRSDKGKTPLSKARTYECAYLLIQVMNDKESIFDNVLEEAFTDTINNQFPEATEAILDDALKSIEGDDALYVYDLQIFDKVTEAESEMDQHMKLRENGVPQLLLHPIMNMYLHLKWQLIKDTVSVFTEALTSVVFVFLLTVLCYKFIGMVTCKPINVDKARPECFTAPNGSYFCVDIKGNWTFNLKPKDCFQGPEKIEGCMFNETHWKKNPEYNDKNPYEIRCRKNNIRTAEKSSLYTPYTMDSICSVLGYDNIFTCWFLRPQTVIVELLWLLMAFREFQEAYSRPLKYFKSKENMLQLTICITSGLFICVTPFQIEVNYGQSL